MADLSPGPRVPVARVVFITLCFFLLSLPSWAQEPVKTFARVWDLVEEKFYNPDLNGWDREKIFAEALPRLQNTESREEATRVINQMLSKLNASHTVLFCADEPDYYQLLDVFKDGRQKKEIKRLFQQDDPHYDGILVHQVDGTVRDVVPGGPADLAGVLPGDQLLEVNGSPFHAIRSFQGQAGQTLQLNLRRGEQPLTLAITPKKVYPEKAFLRSIEESAEVLNHDLYKFGYLRMWSYAGERYHEKMKEVALSRLGETDGLIVDLRGRWGGAQPKFLGFFQSIPNFSISPRGGDSSAWNFQGWGKPVALIVDESVTSGKELLAYGFLKGDIGPIVGGWTAGAVLGGSLHILPGGYVLYLAGADVAVEGQRLEKVGVGPTHYADKREAKARAIEALAVETFQQELRLRRNADQGARLSPSGTSVELMQTVDSDNGTWAKRVVDVWGWPTKDLVGDEASHSFWLLVQHAELSLQERCLELLTKAVAEKQARPSDLAYLEDRIRMKQGRPQLYGTQLWTFEGETRLWPIEDIHQLEGRRKMMNLPTLDEYLKYFGLAGRPLEEIILKQIPQNILR